jgi:hypothetical protein
MNMHVMFNVIGILLTHLGAPFDYNFLPIFEILFTIFTILLPKNVVNLGNFCSLPNIESSFTNIYNCLSDIHRPAQYLQTVLSIFRVLL